MRFISIALVAMVSATLSAQQALELPADIAPDHNNTSMSLDRFAETVKNPAYARTILPHDFNLMVELLTYGKQTDQPREYTRSVFKMFGNLLKGAEYVNPSAMGSLLRQIPDLVSHHFSFAEAKRPLPDNDLFGCDAACYFKQTINNILYGRFSNEFDLFRREPESFLENLSGQLADLSQDHLENEQLRQAIIRFLEIGLGKLIWSPADGEKTWESAKRMGANLASLLKDRIIDDANDLVDLYWTIVQRYGYFIDIAGTGMPISSYQQINADIEQKRPLLLEMDEQEECLESRSSVLTRTLMAGEARRRALETPPAPQPVQDTQESDSNRSEERATNDKPQKTPRRSRNRRSRRKRS